MQVLEMIQSRHKLILGNKGLKNITELKLTDHWITDKTRILLWVWMKASSKTTSRIPTKDGANVGGLVHKHRQVDRVIAGNPQKRAWEKENI